MRVTTNIYIGNTTHTHTHWENVSNLVFIFFFRCLLNVKDHKFGYHFNMEVELFDYFGSQFHLLIFQEGVINNRGVFDRAIGLGRRRR